MLSDGDLHDSLPGNGGPMKFTGQQEFGCLQEPG